MTTTDRLPKETAPAYEAFRAYCEMGGQRSHRGVARKLRKSSTIISRWASVHGWKERSALYDNEQSLAAQHATEQAELELARLKAGRRNEVQEQAWDIAQKLIGKAMDMLEFPLGRQERVESHDGKTVTITAYPGKWSFGDVSRIAMAADTLARLACEMPTNKHELTGPDNKPFTIPQKAQATPIVINVTHDHDTERARALFGERPTKPS